MRRKFIFISSVITSFLVVLGLIFFSLNNRYNQYRFAPNAQSVESVETNRVWLKINSSTWTIDNAITQIHYFNGSSSPNTIWPGVPLSYDLANEAYYYDLPHDVSNYMFTRVDSYYNYLNAKTADLSYTNSINKIYTISGAISGSGEITVTGSYSAFSPLTTTKVSTFMTTLDDGSYICDYNHTLKELNYYYHGLSSFERKQYQETLLYDGVSGSDRLNYLLSKYQIHHESVSSLTAKLELDKTALSVPSSTLISFDLEMFGENGSFISWTSSRSDVLKIINNVATVIPTSSNVTLTLNATLKLLNESSQKSFSVVVEKDPSIQSVNVTWTINLPYAIPSGRQLSIGTDLNDWNPSNTSWGEVSKVSDTQYRFSKSFLKSSESESFVMLYKWVLYSNSDTDMWYGVENAPNNQNRSMTISYASSTLSKTDTISSFENVTSGGSTPVGQGKLTVTSVGGRTIRIYTPSNYNASNTNVRYPVIYMHDGQNLFDVSTSFSGEWEVDEAIENLMSSHNWSGMIAVGIDNTSNRMGEYMYPTGYISYGGSTPSGDVYMNLIVNTIKPYVDTNYNTLPDRESTLLGGSSMGGLISFFGGLHHLNTFGTIMAFSTSTQLVSNANTNVPNTLSSLNQNLLTNTKFFLYVGTSGDGTSSWPDTYKGYLTAKGVPDNNVQTYLGQGYSHNEHAWSIHFPIALKWAMGFGL
ncbi:MAG: alpha/beta hydrolase-fold protein [Bacilli bacterium]